MKFIPWRARWILTALLSLTACAAAPQPLGELVPEDFRAHLIDADRAYTYRKEGPTAIAFRPADDSEARGGDRRLAALCQHSSPDELDLGLTYAMPEAPRRLVVLVYQLSKARDGDVFPRDFPPEDARPIAVEVRSPEPGPVDGRWTTRVRLPDAGADRGDILFLIQALIIFDRGAVVLETLGASP